MKGIIARNSAPTDSIWCAFPASRSFEKFGRPAGFSAIPSSAKAPLRMSSRIPCIVARTVSSMTRGPRVINEAVREEMQQILADIKSGAFAEEWIAENKAGRPKFQALRDAGKAHQIESVGAELRAMMPFISAGKTRVQDASGG